MSIDIPSDLRPDGLLDFIVFGQARSGTTALARYLTAIPEIICANEVFDPGEDHRALPVPSTFFARPDGGFEMERAARMARNRGDSLRYIGNKRPNYYLRLSGILAELNHPPAFCCLRDIDGVGRSYRRRSGNRDDTGWPRGRGPIFAVGDAMRLLRVLEREAPDDVVLVAFPEIVRDGPGLVRRLVRRIDPGLTVSFLDTHLDYARSRRSSKPDTSGIFTTGMHLDAYTVLRDAGALPVLALEDSTTVGQMRAELRAISRALPADIDGFIEETCRRRQDGSTLTYLHAWLAYGGTTAGATELPSAEGRTSNP